VGREKSLEVFRPSTRIKSKRCHKKKVKIKKNNVGEEVQVSMHLRELKIKLSRTYINIGHIILLHVHPLLGNALVKSSHEVSPLLGYATIDVAVFSM
jgi:hypothetical protein